MKNVLMYPSKYVLKCNGPVENGFKFSIELSMAICDGVCCDGWVLRMTNATKSLYISENKGQKSVALEYPVKVEYTVQHCIDIFNKYYGEVYGQVSNLESNSPD